MTDASSKQADIRRRVLLIGGIERVNTLVCCFAMMIGGTWYDTHGAKTDRKHQSPASDEAKTWVGGLEKAAGFV